MNTPRKHHYLPQFYLGGFKLLPQKGKKPHIWQIEKGGQQAHYSPAIEDTGCIGDYHSLDYDDQEPDHKTIEALLSKIEAAHAVVVRSVNTTKRLEASQVGLIAEFISVMRYRIPAFAKHIETNLRSVVLDTFKIMYQAGAFADPPQALRQRFEDNGIDDNLKINISNWKVISRMLEIGLASESINLLAQLNFQIYCTKEADSFVTSDNPVALFHPHYEEIKPYGVGLATKGIELTLPLSSKTLIRAGSELQTGSFIASGEEVAEFNRRTIIMGENYVFASSISTELKMKIRELGDRFAGFTFDNLFYGDGSVHISRFIPVQ
ncbi:MAG: DUF4238 domain-containing protein [Deltaproteobacteria bacterium]|nr:DUF4238 domain-containing protein [Deltaproteobacteria bacterium]